MKNLCDAMSVYTGNVQLDVRVTNKPILLDLRFILNALVYRCHAMLVVCCWFNEVIEKRSLCLLL